MEVYLWRLWWQWLAGSFETEIATFELKAVVTTMAAASYQVRHHWVGVGDQFACLDMWAKESS